ncbi:MAG: acyl-CoA dehydrogenase family protein, partial [Actinomycetota bacterium]|nr:acyl-CoA dehydrogenase family protein [Actinomycetota bacterium]
MDFAFTSEHEALRAMVREFAESHIAPNAEAWDREHYFPSNVVQEMG